MTIQELLLMLIPIAFELIMVRLYDKEKEREWEEWSKTPQGQADILMMEHMKRKQRERALDTIDRLIEELKKERIDKLQKQKLDLEIQQQRQELQTRKRQKKKQRR